MATIATWSSTVIPKARPICQSWLDSSLTAVVLRWNRAPATTGTSRGCSSRQQHPPVVCRARNYSLSSGTSSPPHSLDAGSFIFIVLPYAADGCELRQTGRVPDFPPMVGIESSELLNPLKVLPVVRP